MLTTLETYIPVIGISLLGIGFSIFIIFKHNLLGDITEELDEYLRSSGENEIPYDFETETL